MPIPYPDVPGVPPRKALYTAEDLRGIDHLDTRPGAHPFVRGPYETMYTARPWTIRQYAGFAGARASNAFFHDLLRGGAQALSVAFDLPTHRGYDSDHPLAAADVGRAGVAIDSVEDMDRLFDGIALDRVSVSMTMSGAVLPVLGSFILAARERGIPCDRLSGTIQNDILKEFMVRNTYIHAPAPSLRIAGDVVEYVARHMPRFNAMSISGYHFQEAGADGPLELALTLANGRAYLRMLRERGLEADDICRNLSFFFGVGMDFYGEIAKLRAARILWSEIVQAHGASTPRSQAMRMHCQTSGWSLTAADPLNNVARTAMEALAAVFGGTQSLHTNAYDEALALPSDNAARLARNTQLILQHEAGLCGVIDPWAGSYMMERLTADTARAARVLMDDIEAQGGVIAALESGWLTRRIHIAASRTQAAIDAGERVIVGLNAFRDDGAQGRSVGVEGGAGPIDSGPVGAGRADAAPAGVRSIDGHGIRAEQAARLAALRARRDAGKVAAALDRLAAMAAQGDGNLLDATIAALEVRATVGECTAALERVWPRHAARAEFSGGAYAGARPADDPAWKDACAAVDALRHSGGRVPSVLILKLGQDGHDRGAKAVAAALADAGFRVHLGGLFDTPESAARTAARLGADAVGVSSLAGAHLELVPRLAACLREQGLGHLPLVLGGVVPDADRAALADAGVAAVFGPGTPMDVVVRRLVRLIAVVRGAEPPAAAIAGAGVEAVVSYADVPDQGAGGPWRAG